MSVHGVHCRPWLHTRARLNKFSGVLDRPRRKSLLMAEHLSSQVGEQRCQVSDGGAWHSPAPLEPGALVEITELVNDGRLTPVGCPSKEPWFTLGRTPSELGEGGES